MAFSHAQASLTKTKVMPHIPKCPQALEIINVNCFDHKIEQERSATCLKPLNKAMDIKTNDNNWHSACMRLCTQLGM